MSYRDDFLQAFQNRAKFVPASQARVCYQDLAGFGLEQAHQNSRDFHEFTHRFLMNWLYARGVPESACHNVSSSAMMTAILQANYVEEEVSLTIGDVAFMGEWMYKVNSESLQNIIKEGRVYEKTLDCHVWLTYRSNHVFDLSVLYNLNKRRWYSLKAEEDPVIYWNDQSEVTKWELEYKPILVDNDFFFRVDGLGSEDPLGKIWLSRP